MAVKIAPSLLAAACDRLGAEVVRATQAGADLLHLDVMDGHFVPNLTFGPAIMQALRSHSSLPFDVHLMTDPTLPWIDSFAAAGADLITIHAEIGREDGLAMLARIRALGLRVGIALRPATGCEVLREFLDVVDVILVMTVEPGKGGQPYIHAMTDKIAAVRVMVAGYPIEIEVDGGITEETGALAAGAGADILVAGSALFGQIDLADAITQLRRSADQSSYRAALS